MRRILPPWALLLIAAILFMAGLFWVRANPPEERTPLDEAVADVLQYVGMEVEPEPREKSGLLVKSVTPGSPAEHAGVKAGERVVAVGDRSVWHALQLQELINTAMRRPGGCLLMLEKDGHYHSVVLGFVRLPAPPTHGHSH